MLLQSSELHIWTVVYCPHACTYYIFSVVLSTVKRTDSAVTSTLLIYMCCH